jgi:hypothetical protein
MHFHFEYRCRRTHSLPESLGGAVLHDYKYSPIRIGPRGMERETLKVCRGQAVEGSLHLITEADALVLEGLDAEYERIEVDVLHAGLITPAIAFRRIDPVQTSDLRPDMNFGGAALLAA